MRRWIWVIGGGVLLGTLGAYGAHLWISGPAGALPGDDAGADAGSAAALGGDAGPPDSGISDAAAASLDAAADAGDGGSPDEPDPPTLEAQRALLFDRLKAEHGLSEADLARIRAIFDASPDLGQGNPDRTVHPMHRAECLARRAAAAAQLVPGNEAICGGKHEVPIVSPDAARGAGAEAPQAPFAPNVRKGVCIDQYEFPNIPCEYPVVHVRASEAAAICGVLGKRLCDAHEWEGACAGAVKAPETEYRFNHDRRYSSGMHNIEREILWAYGKTKEHPRCATGSKKTKGCTGGYRSCGSNTYPTGAFPACVSSLGAYDQHGNAAEHMNLPTKPEEMGQNGGTGLTEMKGSWFIFSTTEAHTDDCRWREPSWHESTVKSENSHKNYHLGFRCCRDVAPR